MTYIDKGRAKPEEYEDYIDLMNYVFGFNGVDVNFISRIPKLFKKAYSPWENTFVIREGSKIKASLGLFPGKLNVLGEELSAWGIGGIAVHPNSRSKGYMKELMELAMESMEKADVDIAFLGGKRQRYNYFSYERCGQDICYEVTSINLRHKFGSGKKSGLSLKKVSCDDRNDLNKIQNLLENRDCFFKRDADALYDILTSWGAVPYVAYDNNEFVGYFAISADHKEVIEFNAVSEEYINDIIIKTFEIIGVQSITYHFPPYDNMYINAFSDISERCSIYHVCSFSVFKYKKVIESLLKLKAKHQNLCNGKSVLLIHGIKGDERLKITVNENQILVEHTDEDEDIALSHLGAMNFLFSNVCTQRLNESPILSSWLPLPIYLYRNDHV